MLLFLANASRMQAQVVLDAKRHHLRTAGRLEWDDFAGDKPRGRTLELSFEARAFARDAMLLVGHHNVNLDWPACVRGRPLRVSRSPRSQIVACLRSVPQQVHKGTGS